MGAFIQYLWFGTLFVFCNPVLGQFHLEGQVIDQETKSPITFVNVIFNHSPDLYTYTDGQGHFEFDSSERVSEVMLSHIGYYKKAKQLENIEQQSICFIELIPKTNQLREVSVKSTENPAKKIIRKVIANQKYNMPEKRSFYEFESYDKIIYDFKTNDKNDSIEIRRKLNGSHLFMMEAVTRKTFHYPDEYEEVVLETKVSGFKNPSFGSISSDVQPLSFYGDFITLLGTKYLNPLSDKEFRKYKFSLEQTFIQDKDTVFEIHFKPQKNKKFQGLEGCFHINSDGYAIQNVIAKPDSTDKVIVEIRQEYNRIYDHQWFPYKNSFSICFIKFPTSDKNLLIRGEASFTKVKFVRSNKERLSEIDQMKEKTSARDSASWTSLRVSPLSKQEIQTYKVIDSIGVKKHFDYYMKWMEKGMEHKFPLSFLDIDLTKILQVNKYERARIGVGFFTNEKVSKQLTTGGFLGYGWEDKAWKYGFSVEFFPSKNRQFTIQLLNQNNLEETGSSLLLKEVSFFDFRKFIGYQFDQKKLKKITCKMPLNRFINTNISVSFANVKPLYNYQLISDSGIRKNSYQYSQIAFGLNFEYFKKQNAFFDSAVRTSKYPKVQFLFAKGIKNFIESDFGFSKVEGSIQQSIDLMNLGVMRYKLNMGYVDNVIPYGMLFTGEGGQDSNNLILLKDIFQTMLPYEFLSDKYLNIFLSQNFGGLLFKVNSFQPKITLHHNLGMGSLKESIRHQNLNFKNKAGCFVESGLQLDQLIQLNGMNLFNIGIGFGAFYRYGAYHNPVFKDNVALKMSFDFSIR